MGFTGHLVFGRNERLPLLDAPVFERFQPEVRAAIPAWRPRPGGWQTLQLEYDQWDQPDLAEQSLDELVEWTGAPACSAAVYDSDIAVVTGLDTEGRRWQAFLNVGIAAAAWVEVPEDVQDQSVWVATPEFDEAVTRKHAELEAQVANSARGALVWAAAAGFADGVDQASIEEVLRSHEVFVEDLFVVLLDRLGFAKAEEPVPAS